MSRPGKPARTAGAALARPRRRLPGPPAGTRASANQARVRRQSRETRPRPTPGRKARIRPAAALLGGNGRIRASRQCTGRPSQRRLGDDSRPRRIMRHSPPGGPKLEMQHGPGPVAVDAPLAGDARGPPSSLRTALAAACPWEQSNAEPPYSKERVPRDGHAMLTPRSPRIADRSVVLRCYGSRCNRIMGFVLRRTRCNRLAAECGPLQRTAHRCNSCAAASRAVVLWLLGRLGRSCRGVVSTCVTPAADCGVGVHCLAGSNSPSSVIGHAVGKGHGSSITDPTV